MASDKNEARGLERSAKIDLRVLGLPGRVSLKAESAQHVIAVTVVLREEWTSGAVPRKTRPSRSAKSSARGFDVQPCAERQLDISLSFPMIESNAAQFQDKGGASHMLGKAAVFANNEQARYRVLAEADAKGAAFDPNDIRESALTG